MSLNPLIGHKGLPSFLSIKPTHIPEVITYLQKESDKYIEYMESRDSLSLDEFMLASDKLDFIFQQSWAPISHLTSVKNSDDLRKAYEVSLPKVIEMGLKLEQNTKIYEHLNKIQKNPTFSKVDPALKRIVEKKLKSAMLSGVGLQGDEKIRFNEIAKRLSELSTTFSNNVLDSTKATDFVIKDKNELAGLAESFLAAASQSYNTQYKKTESTPEAGPWRVTLDGPVYVQIMRFAKSSSLREKVYKARIQVASSGKFDNRDLIKEILSLKQEKAKILGYENFAQLSVDNKMAPSVSEVVDFLKSLRTSAKPFAKKDHDTLTKFASDEGLVSGEVKNWDSAYVAECYRKKNFDLDEQELKKYFPFDRVIEGLWKLSERVFGITITEATTEVEKWHDDVRYFKIFDKKSSKQLASFFLDPFSRPAEKRGGAWMNGCVDRWQAPDQEYLPCAYLVCNGNAPAKGTPSLMTFDEVNTLFHEFGHGLQHMLTTVPYMSAAGINGVEWDAVELPSQFMENWCYDRKTLESLTSHVETGKPIDDELYKKLQLERHFLEPAQMLRQVSFSLTDVMLHAEPSLKKDPEQVYRDVCAETILTPVLPEDHFLCAFSHIFAGGYAAGYYSYKWAEVLSVDAFTRFEEAGLENQTQIREIGQDFRDTVLSQGGSRDPMDVFVDFRGRKPDPNVLVKHFSESV